MSATSVLPSDATYAKFCVNGITTRNGAGPVVFVAGGRFTVPLNTVVTMGPWLAVNVVLRPATVLGPTVRSIETVAVAAGHAFPMVLGRRKAMLFSRAADCGMSETGQSCWTRTGCTVVVLYQNT